MMQRILFIELLGGIGDVVIALPAIHALARSHSTTELTVLTFAPGGELLESDPLIHRVVYANPGEARQAVDHLLAHDRFDLIVSDTNYDGIAEAIQQSGTPRVVTNLWQSPPPDQRVGDRFLSILHAENLIPADSSSTPQLHLTQRERQDARSTFGSAYRPLVFLCPDAGMAIKRWAPDRFVAVGKALQQRFNATIVVPVGANADEATAIVDAISGTARLWQRGSLRQFASAIAHADLAIAADTGPARIAAALNVPTLTLFGPSWHERYGQAAPHINLQGAPECSDRHIANFTDQSCWYSGTCPLPQWSTCLDDLSPETVLAAAETLLKPEKSETETRKELKRPMSNVQRPNSLTSWRRVRNLLVLRLDNIGDVLMTSPALRALRENLPDARITLMASPAGALTAPLLPWVDEVLPWRVLWQDLGRLPFDPAREWDLVKTLHDRHFDAAVIFTSFSQSPHPAALVCALAGIPLRLGESKEHDRGTLTHAVPPAPDTIHQVDRNLRLIESVGFQVNDRRLCLAIPSAPHSLTPDSPYLVLNPWTTCQSRNYAPDRFAAAARQLSDRTGYPVVVTGVEKDRAHSGPLLDQLGSGAIDLIGKTSLTELVALIDNAELVLTNNTSTMHIADATNTPNVVLFAGTEYECQWRPRHSPSRLLRRPTVCSPCYAFVCPYNLECLDLPPDAVVEAALELLQRRSPQTSTAVSSATAGR